MRPAPSSPSLGHRSGSAAHRRGRAAAGTEESDAKGAGSRGGMQNSGMRLGVSTLEKAGSVAALPAAEARSFPRSRILRSLWLLVAEEALLREREAVEFGCSGTLETGLDPDPRAL